MNNVSDQRSLARSVETLRELLSGGAQHSRDVVARMAAMQFTPKQVRGARERLNVVARRAGSGKTMHTTWELPPVPASAEPVTEAAHPEVLHHQGTFVSGGLVDQLGKPDAQHLSDGEQRRADRRSEYFRTKGMTGHQASRLALLLATDRDRAGVRLTSCAECQNLNDRGECRAEREGCAIAPRGAFELWHCYLARQEIQ